MTPRQALLGLHVGALAFGLTGVFGKLALAVPLVIVFGRALFAVLSLLPLAWRHPRPGTRQILLLAGGGLLLGSHWLTFFHAVKLSGVAVATLGFASFPAFTVLLEGLLFRERIRPVEWLTLLLVSGGLLLVTPHFELASAQTVGLLWAVLSGLLFALLSVANRATVKGIHPFQAALWQNLTISVCLLPLAWPLLSAVRPLDWLWIGLLGVFCTAIAHSLFVASLSLLKARNAALIFALEPVYGIAVAWWLFGEQPTLRMAAGGLLILLAIALSARQKH
ncbi:MAG TPA: DMT family transporter [Pseudomonas sp.]|nr:DMT family transporter [Pseudomonas sp.]